MGPARRAGQDLAREIREASYDIKDILDNFLVRVDGLEQADLSRLKRTMKKMGDLFSKGKARREISCAIECITKQLQDMTERHDRYRIDDLVTKPATTTCMYRSTTLGSLHKSVTACWHRQTMG
jgi:disease resistance protein RPM1